MRNKRSKLILPPLAVILVLTFASCSADSDVYTNQEQAGTVAEVPNKQWALSKIQAPEAWQTTLGSEDVLIAVIDSGIDIQHEDLVGKVVDNVNYTNSPTFACVQGHGTHQAGIIAAIADNSLGIAGVAPHCRLLNVKACTDDGTKKSSWVASAIVWAADNGAKVINLSLTFHEPSQDLEDAVNYAWNKGAILVTAAGNDWGTAPRYPAYYANCLAVTATDSGDSLAPWAQHGDWVDVAAPGVDIYSTLPDNGYGYKSGTSQAAAHVSGLAGLLFSVATDTNGNGRVNDEVRNMIENCCDEIGIAGVGKGRINALRAVR